MNNSSESTKTSDGIIIELWFREDNSDEWPDSLIQALNDIIQMDPITGLNSIGLRISSRSDEITKELITKGEFLSLNGQPLGGKSAKQYYLHKFYYYIRYFYLSALRDSGIEFSSKKLWGRMLRELKVSDEQKKVISEELEQLNDALLKADPRIEKIRSSLDKIKEIMRSGSGQNTSIQALPMKPWDLMSRSEVVIKACESEVYFPLYCHGQGVQSLAVIFLFNSFIDVFLKPSYQPETVAIMALEEPEAHLHPQAVRWLAKNLTDIKSQKIISSHSPFYIQEVPFEDIRLFRRKGSLSDVIYIKRFFESALPNDPELLKFCSNNKPKFDYKENTSTLIVRGRIEREEYRSLLRMFPRNKEALENINKIKDESQSYLSKDELMDLDTWAKRIRGEVFFASAWLLCEGQSDYLIIRYFAELLGTPLDQVGITIIDFQNNGSPGAFIGLAQTFEIPWVMICDNDEQGKQFIRQASNRGLSEELIKELVYPLPENMDLEIFLAKNGFAQYYVDVLTERNVILDKQIGEDGYENEIAEKVKSDKTGYTIALIKKLRSSKIDNSKIPDLFKSVINYIISRVS